MKFSNEIKDYKQNFKKDRKSKMILLGGLFSFLGVILIKTIIRPQHFHLSTLGTFLQGTLPNFFAATGFCAIVFIYYNLFFKNDQDASLSKRITFASLFAFIGLTSWEIIQYFMGYPIDYDDILMTALGSLTMSFVILTIYKFVTDVKSKTISNQTKNSTQHWFGKSGADSFKLNICDSIRHLCKCWADVFQADISHDVLYSESFIEYRFRYF